MVFATLPLPEPSTVAGYNRVSRDWTPDAHAPECLFSVPHFLEQLYITTESERLAIDLIPAIWVVPARPDRAGL